MTARTDRRSGRAAAIWHVLVGPPLRARDASREQITPVEGLSALSLDALTSIAYGPEAILAVLAVAGAGALHLVLPITAAIVALLASLVFSYRQVIDAYPGGGGAYSVSRDNFGERVSLLAAAALVVDYTLFNIVTAATVGLGVAALYLALFIAMLAAALLLVPGNLLSLVLGHRAGVADQVSLAWLATSIATLGGALGAVLETRETVREAAYTYQPDTQLHILADPP
jgi:amino acid transporter